MQQNSRGAELRSGKRSKRKLPDQSEPSHSQRQQPLLDTTIPEILGTNGAVYSKGSHQQSTSPSTKRPRVLSLSSSASRLQALIAPDEMYNFSSGESKTLETLGQSSGVATTTTTRMNYQSYNVPTRQSNFTPHTGPKRLIVKNLRTGSRLNQDAYFDKVWAQLDSALTAIFKGDKPEASLEELYKGAENLCRQGRAAILAKKLQDTCRDHVTGKLRDTLLNRATDDSNTDTLRAVIETWTTWRSRLITVRWIFYYLDQSFLLHSKDLPVIREMGITLFRTCLFSDSTLKPKILQGACDLIEADRGDASGSVGDSSLLRNAISFFHDLNVYSSDFEPLLLTESKRFFSLWAQQEAAGYLANFAENSHRLLDWEIERCDFYSLSRNTRQVLSELFDQIVVTEQQATLLREEDVLGLLRAGNSTALEKLYSLLERRHLGTKLKASFNKYIIDEGTLIVFDDEKETEMVTSLLQFKQQLDNIWNDSFHRDEELGRTLRESFETFMNKAQKFGTGSEQPKTGEMIAKYLDMLLKGGWRVHPGQKPDEVAFADEDAEINRQLDQVLDLFRFVHGKAVFEAFYKNDLARRLLMNRSASDDAEKSMLAKLKTECGSAFTHNLESMFKDVDVARDEMTAYNSLQREKRNRALDLNVNVLSAAAWPSYPDVPVRIPMVIATALNDFEQFYHNKYNGRKLHWKHQLAHCQLTARFPKGSKELVVSSFQAIVLLLFNDVNGKETLSYTQIKEATGLSDPELKRTLQSLACAKYRVLIKKPKGRDIDPLDVFSYNAGFTDAKMRIKINQIQLKETKEENKKINEQVTADRHYETQAAIVRIMKSRKKVSHQVLVAEVLQATRSRGALDPADIKKNIEKLIEKDYMERQEDNLYNYVA